MVGPIRGSTIPTPKSRSVTGKKNKKGGKLLQRHHGMLAVIIVVGWLVPPLAVLIRFGIGIDFFLNIIFTCMGYFPGHFHNWFIQNVRNNYGRGRTPKWALKAGLVQDDTEYVKSTRQWGHRYGERNTRNAYDDEHQPYVDEHGNEVVPNAVERFVENHGMHPAQPSAGFGTRGNDIIPVEDSLLEGLPDEDKERRRREKKYKKHTFGAGLEERDRDEMERESGGNSTSRNNNSLIGDLDDFDRPSAGRNAGSGLAARRRDPSMNAYDDHTYNSSVDSGLDRSSSGGRGFGGFGKKSGRSKKSERYGLAADHRDLSGGGGGGSGGNNPYTSGSLRERREAAGAGRGSNNPYGSSGSSRYESNDRSRYESNDRSRYDSSERNRYDDTDRNRAYDKYDIVDDRNKRRSAGRSGGGDDDEDFLNHQF